MEQDTTLDQAVKALMDSLKRIPDVFDNFCGEVAGYVPRAENQRSLQLIEAFYTAYQDLVKKMMAFYAAISQQTRDRYAEMYVSALVDAGRIDLISDPELERAHVRVKAQRAAQEEPPPS